MRTRLSAATTRKGTSTLELAAGLPVLLLILGATIDFSYISLINHQLSYAARVASRWGITGQQVTEVDAVSKPVAWCGSGTPPANPRVMKLRQLIYASLTSTVDPDNVCLSVLSYSGGYPAVGDPEPYLDLNDSKAYDQGEPFTDVNGDGVWSLDQGSAALGAGGDVAVYVLRYSTPPITGLTPGLPATMAFEARVVVRNEPYLTR